MAYDIYIYNLHHLQWHDTTYNINSDDIKQRSITPFINMD